MSTREVTKGKSEERRDAARSRELGGKKTGSEKGRCREMRGEDVRSRAQRQREEEWEGEGEID